MLLGDESFWCHKTIDYSEASEGSTNRKTQHCAGALILLEKLNRPNQLMRIAERIRCYDRTQLDMAAPVFEAPGGLLTPAAVRMLPQAVSALLACALGA